MRIADFEITNIGPVFRNQRPSPFARCFMNVGFAEDDSNAISVFTLNLVVRYTDDETLETEKENAFGMRSSNEGGRNASRWQKYSISLRVSGR